MSKRFFTKDASRGMDLENGKRHYDSNGKPLGGIKAKVVNTDNQQIEVEQGEVIITRDAVSNPKKYKIEGTTKEILSTLNQEGGGVPINDTEAEIVSKYRKGGRIPREKHKLYLGEDGGMGVSSKSEFETAVQMEKEGIDNETIRTLTGWFRNPFDKLWRYEISDKDAEVDKDFLNQITGYLSVNKDEEKAFFKLDKFYKNEDLFKAYPSIKNILVNFIWDENDKTRGSVITSANPKINEVQIKININEIRQSSDKTKSDYATDIKSTLTHELQHVIQIREGLGGGSSFVRQFRQLSEKYKNGLLFRNGRRITPNGEDDAENLLLIKNKAIKNYQNSSGEIESRDAQQRIDLSSGERKIAIPYSSIEFKEKDVTVDLERKIIFKTGGSIGDMTPSELKAFYASPEGKKLDAETYIEWKRLVNMTKSELEKFYHSEEGLGAGLSRKEATKHGIDSGRESAEWIMKMKDIPYKEWTSNMWRWAKKQISFIKRMSGVKGGLYDDKGKKTRKHTALLIWGHNPKKKLEGGGYVPKDVFTKSENERNEDYEANWNLWTETLLKNESLPIYWTTSESRKELYGDSFYITIFNEDWQEFSKLRFSGHSVMNTGRLQNEFHNPNISRFYEIVSRAMNLKQQEKYPENSIKFEGGGSVKEEEMEKEMFMSGGDIMEKKEYDFNDYYSVKDLTKSLIEKYNSEVDSKGKKNKGTKINIESRIDSLYRIVNENPSKYLKDFIDFNNSLPKSFILSSHLMFFKEDYSNNEGIINYLIESKKNPLEFYEITPYKLPKRKNFKVSPNDSVFMGIHDDFIGNDPLRPIMTGTYFSEKGVVSTNAHILLFTKNRGGEDKFDGVYCHTKKCIEDNKDQKIDGKFPNYEMVIPSTQDYSKDVDTEYLLTYLKNANKYRLFNAVTHATVFSFETSEGVYEIALNTEFLESCIESMIELGHRELSLNFIEPSRALVITPKGKTNEDARGLYTDFALCMPVKIDQFDDVKVFNYDLDTNCSKYLYNSVEYCFNYEHTEKEILKKEVKELKEKLKSKEEVEIVPETNKTLLQSAIYKDKNWGERIYKSNSLNELNELIEYLGKTHYLEELRDATSRRNYVQRHELDKGTEHEMEHLATLKKVAEGKVTPKEAVVETAKTHIAENPEYYEDLAKMELETLKDKLKNQGYNVTIPSGGNRISVIGYGKGYFNAKKQKADSILSSLKRNGYNAVSELDADGYYDFWVYSNEPKQDLAKMEVKNGESITDLIEGLKVLAESLEGAEKKEIEEVIEGLEILLESEDKFEGGGELAKKTAIKTTSLKHYKELLSKGYKAELVTKEDLNRKFAVGGEIEDKGMFFEPNKTQEDEERMIMENQFGKNI